MQSGAIQKGGERWEHEKGLSRLKKVQEEVSLKYSK